MTPRGGQGRATPWRPPLFEALGDAGQRRALAVSAPSPEGRAYLQAFRADPSRWRYGVLDELVDDVAGLVVTPWPTLDGKGRLRAGRGDRRAELGTTFAVHVPLVELQAFVDGHRARAHALGLLHDEALVGRRLRIGDTFALGCTPGPASPAPGSPAVLLTMVDDDDGRPVWLHGAPGKAGTPVEDAVVLDLSFDAREASRVAYYAAMTPTLTASHDRDLVVGSALEGLARQRRRR